MLILGTQSGDRVRLDRKPDRGPYVISANTPIRGGGRSCRTVGPNVAECRLADAKHRDIAFFLYGGSDRVRITTRHYASSHVIVDVGRGADRVIVGHLAEVVSGGSGDDRIRGRAGADALYGDKGSDTLNGGYGRDRLAGGFGRDRCAGGPGRDRRGGC